MKRIINLAFAAPQSRGEFWTATSLANTLLFCVFLICTAYVLTDLNTCIERGCLSVT